MFLGWNLDTYEEIEKAIFRLKNYIFWDITPCNLVEVNRHFDGIYSRDEM
jgi:hypothetical protein